MLDGILGIVVGLAAFLIIGLFHPIVIKSEYRFGVKCWPAWVASGVLFLVVAVLLGVWTQNIVPPAIAGVVAFSCFWGIKELFEQRERVRKGWFPANPDRPEEPAPATAQEPGEQKAHRG
ncbi:MAG: DUF4491 family protein [Coriobacteriales bacterium]|jgi:uncharacterized membrane protein YqjE|nr:DUF4491 family protein [Coriobacteriales bacterium]